MLYMLKRSMTVLSSGDYQEVDKLREQCEEFKNCLSQTRKEQMERMRSTKDNITVSYVYLNILQETHEIVSALQHLLRAARHFASNN